jgi:hypothetical protein
MGHAREFGENAVVDAEVAREAARRLRQDRVRRIGHDGCLARMRQQGLATRQAIFDGGRGDRRARPQRIEGNAVRAVFLGHAEHHQAHAEFADGVGHVRREPVRRQVERRAEREHLWIGGTAQVWHAQRRDQEAAAHVDLLHEVIVLHCQAVAAAEVQRTGIVDAQVYAAECGVDRAVRRSRGRCRGCRR